MEEKLKNNIGTGKIYIVKMNRDCGKKNREKKDKNIYSGNK